MKDFKCKLYCYESCTLCHLAATTDRHKTQYKSSQTCERCFLCRSVVFCPTYHKCPHRFSKYAYRGQTEPVLEITSYTTWASRKVIRILKEGYTLLVRIRPTSTRSQWLCTSLQEELSDGGVTLTLQKIQ